MLLDRTKFAAAIAADVNAESAEFMADSQVPWGARAFGGACWTTQDKMIPPDAQRAMSKRAGAKVVEAKGSHAICASKPEAVAAIIEEAATGAARVARESKRQDDMRITFLTTLE